MIARRHCLAALASGLLALSAAPVLAQDAWPKGPIRFVVPYPPGGPTDLMARLLQPELSKRLGVPVIIDNRSGAGGNVGSAEVAKQAPADGQTLLLAASGPMAVNSSLFKSMPFNALSDLAPVVQLSAFPLVLEVNPGVNAKNLKEFIALAKAQKDPMTYASAGNGTPQHLAAELFQKAAGVKLSHIPYRGAGPALTDVVGGQVKVMFDILGSSLPHIQGGKLRPIAVTSAKRSPQLPNVPTMAEAGLPNFETTAWHGIAVRAGTPAPIIHKLNAAVLDTFKDPAFRAKWEAIGTPVVAGTPEQFGALIRTETVRLGRVVREAGVTVD
ncbi:MULTISPECIES: tripartite tricarboxylate transporter substrate binding protein [Ramlibacter]|uniref:Tripartite tricarboxylate transporter substrate binding protein n=1 Tax=Ramlibacter aquaticus TaxID=2780094 RepID=A0ABR9SHH2_9BURK|nr:MULTISPECIES: tripartite tricarboxylate transporter substrate binding protein [Ramlibacter]MBE7941801.1 tripartite tricarboxylate transporter substrate binding protein [Ramlibacter aquaticus]